MSWWWGTETEERSERERYLEDELARKQEEEQDRRRQEAREREARERERRELHEERRRTASTWPEALRKQRSLFQEEAAQWPQGDPEFVDDYFAPGVEAIDRALELWKEEEAKAAETIKRLEFMLKVAKDRIRMRVADRLTKEHSDILGWREVARALREEDMNRWLDW